MELQRRRFNQDLIQTLTDYIQQGGDSSGIELTEKDNEVLERVRYADEKIRENKFSRELISKSLIGKYNICRDTAYKMIIMAEHIFSSSYPLNKNAEIERRIEFLKKVINDCIIDKDFLAASNFEKSLQKYIDMYKDIAPKRSPKTIVYNIQNNIHQTNVTVEQAMEETEGVLKLLENREDY